MIRPPRRPIRPRRGAPAPAGQAAGGRRGRPWGERGWWRADRGSAATEVALVTPPLILLLVLVAVVVHRGVTARLSIDDAAHQAARAASLARTLPAAAAAADAVARDSLAATSPACTALTARTDTSQLRPGGTVTVTLTCTLDLSAAAPQGLLGRELSATATEPIDTYRFLDTAPGP